jgi:photosynthetic reaction center cytochrome c subunit
MNRIASFVVTAAFVISGVIIALNGQPNPVARMANAPQSNAGTKTAEQVFKNIQVFKGVPADQLIPTMQFIAAALGVECDFCHVQGAFDKDDKKPKQIARKMVEMMVAINADNFDRHRQVTCYSCHRGNARPLAIPAVMGQPADTVAAVNTLAGPTMAPPEPQPNNGPTADQLLDKYVQAAGGAAAIDKVSSRVMKGAIDFSGKSFPIDVYCKAPDQRISFTHLPQGDSVTAFNGHEGWLAMTGRPPREMHGSDLEAAAIDADLHLPTHLKGMFSGMEVRGAEKIDDHPAYVLIGQREGKPAMLLYFDEQSGLLVRMVRFADTAVGLLPTQIDYADYKESDGVEVPLRWTLSRPEGRFTIQISEIQQNVPVDESKFVKPPAHEEQKAGGPTGAH